MIGNVNLNMKKASKSGGYVRMSRNIVPPHLKVKRSKITLKTLREFRVGVTFLVLVDRVAAKRGKWAEGTQKHWYSIAFTNIETPSSTVG